MTAIVVAPPPLTARRGGTRFTAQQRAAKIPLAAEDAGAETLAEGPGRHN